MPSVCARFLTALKLPRHMHKYIPVTQRACYFNFMGSENELKELAAKLNLGVAEDANHNVRLLALREALAKGLLAQGPNVTTGIRSLSLINDKLVTWQTALRFMNEAVREYTITVHTVEDIVKK